MTISRNDERILKENLKPDGMTVLPRTMFGSATTKKMAFHCYHNSILFHWSNANFYFEKVVK